MATTKIWSVKDSLSRLVEYARNPEKTEYDNLKAVYAYARDEDKTVFEKGEKCYLVTALNCRGDPLKSMMQVHNHFNAKGENIAYHAYQSFKPGEVTPEQCHEIGVKLAERLWGSHYQVLITSHMNCSHLHNHFVILATSFRTGKKLDTGNDYWGRVLVPASDKICREYGLSVTNKRGRAAPRCIYMAEKNGEPTKYRLIKDALHTALNLATDEREFKQYLRDIGYEIDLKSKEIKSIFSKKWISLERIAERFGDYFNPESYKSAMDQNAMANAPSYFTVIKLRREQNGMYQPKRFYEYNSLETFDANLTVLGNILKVFMTMLGWLPEQAAYKNKFEPLSPEMKAEMRDAQKKCEMYSRAAVVLARESLKTGEQTLDYMNGNVKQITALRKERRCLYYKADKAETPEDKALVRDQIAKLNEKIKKLSTENTDLTNVLERSGVMQSMIQNELQMRREKRERDFLPDVPMKEAESPESAAPRGWAERAREASRGAYGGGEYAPKPKHKSRDDDDAR